MPKTTRILLVIVVLFGLAGTIALTSSWAKIPSKRSRSDQIVYTVTPSDADPAIRDFDDPTYVIFNKDVAANAPLVLFLPGTDGKPGDRPMMRLVADLGYRTLNLQYNDDLSVNPVCPRDPAPDCSDHFRADRIYGDGASTYTHTPPAETITNRLVKTLLYLDKKHPQDHWGAYLANGEPNWPRIVVSGLSQGAGMAAFIAKQHEVARVVLFSSPADFVFDDGAPNGSRPAPWLSQPSATPAERWYAEYHAREHAAGRLQDAYVALGIPTEHVFTFDLDMPAGYQGGSENPFHGSTVRNPGYAKQWRAMYGEAPP